MTAYNIVKTIYKNTADTPGQVLVAGDTLNVGASGALIAAGLGEVRRALMRWAATPLR